MEKQNNQAVELSSPLEIERHKTLAQFYGHLFNSKFEQVDINCRNNGNALSMFSIMAYHRDEYAVIKATFQQLAEYHHATYLLLTQQLNDFLNNEQRDPE